MSSELIGTQYAHMFPASGIYPGIVMACYLLPGIYMVLVKAVGEILTVFFPDESFHL